MRGGRWLRAKPATAARLLRVAHRTAPPGTLTSHRPTLGLVTFETALAGPISTVHAIGHAVRDAGYPLCVVSAGPLDAASVTSAVESLRARAVAGILAVAPTDRVLAALAVVAAEIPLVAVGAGDPAGVPVVGVDNVAGAALATRHLLDLGHATVHHIAGPAGWPAARERLDGWRAALREAAAPAGRVFVGDWSVRSGYEAARHLAADPRVTAIFCANDQMALGALRALHLAGRAVPAQVSVVGFDDIPEAPFLRPPLTTVRQDLAALGRAGVDLLGRQIAVGTRAVRHVRLPLVLVKRDSSARPPCER